LQQKQGKADGNDFEKFGTLLPPKPFNVPRDEPSLAEPLAEYRSTGKSEKLLQHMDSKWKVNNTLFDHDYLNRCREQYVEECYPLEFHAMDVAESMGVLETVRKPDANYMERLVEVFRGFCYSILSLGCRNRLVVEMIVGEVADIMERIRYQVLDYRLSTPKNDSWGLDTTHFPLTFDYIHLSNVP
jgi:hypothetical protein